MTVLLKATQFTGGGKIYGAGAGHLTDVITKMAQFQGKTAAAAVSDLTDNSGGAAADGTIGAIPLATPAQVDQGAMATGTILIATNPAADDTITVNGTAITFKASGASGNQVNLGGSAALTAAALHTFLAASADTSIDDATYAVSGATVTVTYAANGTAGNAFTLATSVSGKITLSGATLSGGLANVGVQKAAFDAAIATVRNALMEVVDQSNTIRGKVPAFSALTNSIGGTAADGTIAAVTLTFTAVDTSFVDGDSFNTIVATYRNAVAKAAFYVNKLCRACGVTELVDSSGGEVTYTTTFAALSATSASAVDGASAGDGHGGVTKTQGDATLTALGAAIKELATKLNACTSDTVPAAPVVAS